MGHLVAGAEVERYDGGIVEEAASFPRMLPGWLMRNELS